MFYDTEFMTKVPLSGAWAAAHCQEMKQRGNSQLLNICESLDCLLTNKGHSPKERLSLRAAALLINGTARMLRSEVDCVIKEVLNRGLEEKDWDEDWDKDWDEDWDEFGRSCTNTPSVITCSDSENERYINEINNKQNLETSSVLEEDSPNAKTLLKRSRLSNTEPLPKRRRIHRSSNTEPSPEKRIIHRSSDTEPAPKRRRIHRSSDTEPSPKRRRIHRSSITEPSPEKRRIHGSSNIEPSSEGRRIQKSSNTEPAPKRIRIHRSSDTEPSPKRRRIHRSSITEPSPEKRRIHGSSNIGPSTEGRRIQKSSNTEPAPKRRRIHRSSNIESSPERVSILKSVQISNGESTEETDDLPVGFLLIFNKKPPQLPSKFIFSSLDPAVKDL